MSEKTFQILVEVTENEQREVASHHEPANTESSQTMSEMYTYGNEQASIGLLTEALKRESFFQWSITVTNDPEFYDRWVEMSDDEKEMIILEKSEHLIEQTLKTTEMMAEDIVRYMCSNVLPQLEQSKSRIKEGVEEKNNPGS
ncbi:MAG: hypothetical protein AAGM67_13185 [Bacteroidota bacterium]